MTNDTMLPIGGTLDVRTTLPAFEDAAQGDRRE
jgi:hypothetical protein